MSDAQFRGASGRKRALSSLSFRLAAFYLLLFSASVAALGGVVFVTTRAVLAAQLDERITTEMHDLMADYRNGGLPALRREIITRSQQAGRTDYGLIGPGGALEAGILNVRTRPGWTNLTVVEPNDPADEERILTTRLPDGRRLLVSDTVEHSQHVLRAILIAFAGALVLVLLLGLAGGLVLSRAFLSRIEVIDGAARAIIDGDLSHRIPIRPGGRDELADLSATLNRMLDRIQVLLESLRQVSNDVAHDLRTPLTRLRQRLEAAQGVSGEAERSAAIERALADIDQVLRTFEAILRIAQIEAGAGRRSFADIDLGDIAGTVAEAYAPTAEDAGGSLTLGGTGRRHLTGDRELLLQLLSNLVENVLTHGGTPPRIEITLAPRAGVDLAVRDHGPGIADAEKEHVFRRFYRLDKARGDAGAGLGLALVRATARLHGAEVWLEDASPGLRVCLAFGEHRQHAGPTDAVQDRRAVEEGQTS